MKKITPIAIVLVIISVLLTSCGEPEVFEPAPIITTTKVAEEEVTYKYSDFSVFGARMGMSVEETQQAIGVQAPVYANDNITVYFTVNKKGLPFVTDGLDCSIYFIYDADLRLCEVQYISITETGFVLDEAIASYDKKYGKHAVVHADATKTNYVWYSDGAYILITTLTNGQNAMSFFGEDYFKITNPEETQAYSNV